MAISARSRSEAETTAEGWPAGRGQSPSNHHAHDCKDAGGRAKQEARAENRSVYKIHVDRPDGLGLKLAVLTVRLFVRLGRGTPAPWDPPKGLVVAGVIGTSATR